MQIVKMQFSRCEAMTDTGSARIELRSILDLSNPLAVLQSGGATTAGFFVRHVLDGLNDQQQAQALQKLTNAFQGHTFDVKRITVPVAYLSDGKATAVQVKRADDSVQTLSSLVFNSVQESDTDETMINAAKVAFVNAVMSGRYVLVAQQQRSAPNGGNGGNSGNTNTQHATSAMQGDFTF